jgi:flavoprotein hydroxylase
MELGKVICVPNTDEAAARDEVMAAAVSPEPARVAALPGIDDGLVRSGSPHAGELFVQGTVHDRPFDDVHGAGWRLVTNDITPDAIDADLSTWFATIGGRVVTLHAPGADHARWFAAHGATWALVRPDFHLYGTATSGAIASALLAALRHDLMIAIPEGASR